MDFADPAELLKKARECEAAADRIEQIGYSLYSQSSTSFTLWTGVGATSLNHAIVDQTQFITDASVKMREAAAALRAGAVLVRQAKEAEERRLEALQKLTEAKQKQLRP